MSFLSERPGSHYIGAVIGVLVLGLIGRSILSGGIEEYFDRAKQVENQIVEAMEERPGDLAVLRAMEAHFPLDYDEMLDQMTDAGIAEMDALAAAEAGSGFLARFLVSHKNDFANAPSAALADVLVKEKALLAHLAETDAVVCGDYVFGTIQADDKLGEETGTLLGNALASKVYAMSAGRSDQQIRFQTTPRDIEALSAEMLQQGASPEQVAALVGDGDIFALDHVEQCGAALALVRAIDEQPEEREELLVATFLGPAR